MLARVFSVALDRGWISKNPCEKGGRIYGGSRVDIIWSDEQEAQFLTHTPAHLHLPLILALWTGQRQGDLLRMPWSAYDGTHIRLQPRKTKRHKITIPPIPVGAPLKAALDAAKRVGPIILTTTEETPWTINGFGSSSGKACKKAGIVGVTFNDLRGTAVTRLFVAGCTVGEIVTITGHKLNQVQSILDAHYFHRDSELAENAIRKLESRTKTANRTAN